MAEQNLNGPDRAPENNSDDHLAHLLPPASIEKPWFLDIYQNIKDLISPPKLPPLEQLAARLPTRLDTAKRMLTERGIKNLEQHFRAFNQYLPDQGTVYRPDAPHEPSCIPWDRTYTLPEIFMMGDECLAQMRWPSSPLPEREQDLLDVPKPMLTHAELEQRFQQDFDAAIGARDVFNREHARPPASRERPDRLRSPPRWTELVRAFPRQ